MDIGRYNEKLNNITLPSILQLICIQFFVIVDFVRKIFIANI
jgi:hypothetical protein